MSRLLGILGQQSDSVSPSGLELGAVQEAIIQDGVEVSLQSHPTSDLFLATLLRERNERVGNGSAAGEGVFDFRYGPFTGGIGETGVMHLSTYGEKLLAVDIELGTKHRGIESSLVGLRPAEAFPVVERTCGNFSFAHSHAFAAAVEEVEGIELNERTRRHVLIAAELERIYNHLYVITRLAEAAAQHVLASHLGSLFEEALRLNAEFSGSRYLMGIRGVGSLSCSSSLEVDRFAANVARLKARFERLYQMSLSSRNYLDRLHGIAVVDRSRASSRSLTGPSLRATGIEDDLRSREELLAPFTPILREEGDSLARMEVRAEEILLACTVIAGQLELLDPADRGAAAPQPQSGSGRAVGAAEGPSGVVAWAVDMVDGEIREAYVSTPSLFGFQVFAEVLTGHIFTDFPFALDSFGLSFADAAR